MRKGILISGLVGIALAGALVKRHCDRCEAETLADKPIEQNAPVDEVLPSDTPAANLEVALFTPVSLNMKDVTLRQAVADLQRISGANIVIDEAALEVAGVSPEQCLSLKVENVSCRSALNLIVQQAKLAFVIRDEVAVVTTQREAEGKLEQVTYNVADLVVPVDYDNVPANFWDDGPRQKQADGKIPAAAVSIAAVNLPDKLVTTITGTVRPDSWRSVAGVGQIHYFPLGMALVVHQTPGAHEEIKQLLATLRRAQDTQIALEIRVFQSPTLRIGLTRDNQVDANAALEVAYLDDRRCKEFMESLQADGRTSVMQAPKITLFNGQRAAIHSIDERSCGVDCKFTIEAGKISLQAETQVVRSGFRYAVCPTVSEDRRSVRVHLQAGFSRLDPVENAPSLLSCRPATSTLKVDRCLRIPAGQSALVHCGSMKELRNACPEWLRELPGVGAVLRQLGASSEETQVAILITPRIIVAEEEEQIFLGELPPMPRP